jgi:hypothetical protein
MCRLANAAFPRNGFAQRPAFQSLLDLPPPWRRLFQQAVGGKGDNKSATTFFKPGRYKSCTLNSEINAKWGCCLGKMGMETHDRALTRGLWLVGALTIRPPTNRPRDISTHTIRPPDKPSAVTFYYCDIPSQGGRIVRPPNIVTFPPSKFGRFVSVTNRLIVIFCPKVCDILSMLFLSNFAVTFRPNVTKGPFFPKIRQFLLTFMCGNRSLKGLPHEISCFFVDPVTKRPQFAEQVCGTSQMPKNKATKRPHFAEKPSGHRKRVGEKSCDKTSTCRQTAGRLSQMGPKML